ncbi:T-cell surface glycoprotein CD3 zeta chain [Anolis sagrei]|uniref:T-cell surface glycoprotein CD3 zeta chain n=1 Tax=Anolis sagrei TaxID=38937 RepID=UPI00352163BD
MKWKRILIAAILQAWLPITDAGALGLADPRLCYILDGILLIYAIVITACFVKTKLSRGHSERTSQNTDTIYNKLSSGRRDEYDSLGVKKTNNDVEMGRKKQHRRNKSEDRVYSSLQRDKMGEAYSEIGKKGERRRGKGNDAVYQGLSAATKDTYDVLQMQQMQTPY